MFHFLNISYNAVKKIYLNFIMNYFINVICKTFSYNFVFPFYKLHSITFSLTIAQVA